MRRTATVLFGLLGLVAASRRELEASDNPVFIIRTGEEAQQVVKLHATNNSEVMFTTVSFSHKGGYSEEMAEFATHLWQSLREIGRLENAIIFSYDLATCEGIMKRGIPCFVDRWSLQPSHLPGQYGSDNPHWYSKYSWALAILEWGYTAVFFELDMVFVADPLPFYNSSVYDLEGLSDWRRPQVPGPKARFTDTCSVYHMYKREDGSQTLGWGPGNGDDPRVSKHVNPCMSTGFWFAQPTESAKTFLRDYIQLAIFELHWEVDQIVWNEVIMAFLIGSAGYHPLRMGLLDDESFSNFEVYNWRVEQKLPSKPVMLHCGALSQPDKYPMIERLGLWKAGYWEPSAAKPFLKKLAMHLPLSQPRHSRHQTDSI